MEELETKDKRFCSNCDSNVTYTDKRGHRHWYGRNGNWYCERCDNKLFKNPKWHPITNPASHKKWNPTHMRFRGHIICLDKNPRKGICCLCNKKGPTDMHHIKYHDDDPLKDAIELCDSCHGKDSAKRRYGYI